MLADPLTTPVADEPDATVLAGVATWATGAWLAGEEVALPEFADSEL